MEEDNLYSCAICMEEYNEDVRPRTLHCGHSYCTSCLNNSISESVLVCPHCKYAHRAATAQDFPISYGMEEMISKLKKVLAGENLSQQAGASCKIKQSPARSQKFCRQLQPGAMSSKMLAIIQEQEDNSKQLVQESKGMRSQLHQYNNFLLERKEEHEGMHQKVLSLANHHEEMAKDMGNESDQVVELDRQGESLEKKIHDNLETLSQVTTAKDALSAIDELDQNYLNLEKWGKTCQEQIPNGKAISCSERSIRETKAALSMWNTEEHDVAETLDFSQFSMTIMEKVTLLRDKPYLTLANLQNMSSSLKTALEKGLMYAVELIEDYISRSSRISVKKNQVFLHCLRDGKPPTDSLKIKQSDLIGFLNTDSVEAFMDLSWDGSVRGRIHILLSPDTPFARHFRILCTGDLGPSYTDTKFFHRGCRASYNEYIIGGDYEYNDGRGGAPVISGLDRNSNIYSRSFVGGLVGIGVLENNGPKCAQFKIFTGNGNNGNYNEFFGQIINGMNVVKEAAKLDNVSRVSVVDCGVVLPF